MILFFACFVSVTGANTDTAQQQIGVEFGTKIITLGDCHIKLQIWDTAGQERYLKQTRATGLRLLRIWYSASSSKENLFCNAQKRRENAATRYRAVTRSYYRGAVGALILYDCSSRESYNNLPTWLRDAREQASFNDISIIAVGNKRDLKEERQVSFLEASRFAQEQDILFLETSALTGENVNVSTHFIIKSTGFSLSFLRGGGGVLLLRVPVRELLFVTGDENF